MRERQTARHKGRDMEMDRNTDEEEAERVEGERNSERENTPKQGRIQE